MNVVFLVLDTVRRDRLSPYNEEIEFTENLEEFSQDAQVFEEAVAQAPWTLPVHASMFTGQYPWEHEATQRKPKLETDQELLAEKLSGEGYRTGCFSYNAFLSSSSRLTDGFETLDNFTEGIGKYLPVSVADKWNVLLAGDRFSRIKSFVQRTGLKFFHSSMGESSDCDKVLSRSEVFVEDAVNSGEDFFLFVNLMEAHEPYYPPEEYLEKHAPEVDISSICQDPAEFLSGRKDADFDDISNVYNACIDYLDDRLGQFFDFLEEKEVEEETLVILCSDHGQLFGEDGMYGHQLSVAEELVHVPLMVKSPEIEAGREEDQVELRQLYDLVPEWLEGETGFDQRELALGGYEFPDMFIKLLPEEKREEFYKRFRFVRGDGKKIVESASEEGDKTYEMIDLRSGEEIEVDEEFRKKVESIDEDVAEGELEAEDEIKDRLEELGYM